MNVRLNAGCRALACNHPTKGSDLEKPKAAILKKGSRPRGRRGARLDVVGTVQGDSSLASLSTIIDLHSHPILPFGQGAPVGPGRKQPAEWGVPIGQVDTWLDCTLTPFRALAALGIELTKVEQNSLYQYWHYIAYLLGLEDSFYRDVTDHDSARELGHLFDL